MCAKIPAFYDQRRQRVCDVICASTRATFRYKNALPNAITSPKASRPPEKLMGRCRCCLLVAASLLTTAAAAAFGWFYVWQVLYAPYLQGARDIVYDAARERVIISALHSNVIAVVDVATPSKPRTLGWRADDAFTNAHGFAYDHGSATAYVASYGRGSLAKVDLRNPARDKLPVVATLENDELYSATHASYDAARNLVFVTAAGSHDLGEDADVLRGGHDLLVVDAATMRRTGLLTEWGAGAEPAYPVYCVYDAARALLFASNDARNRLEVVDVGDAARPAVVGEVAAVPELAYVSQLALDAPSNLIIAASQKGDSVAVVDVADAANPKILGSLTSDALDGATGVAYDAARRLAYVASEFAGTLSVVNVTDRSTPVIVAGVCAPCGNRPLSLGHAIEQTSRRWHGGHRDDFRAGRARRAPRRRGRRVRRGAAARLRRVADERVLGGGRRARRGRADGRRGALHAADARGRRQGRGDGCGVLALLFARALARGGGVLAEAVRAARVRPGRHVRRGRLRPRRLRARAPRDEGRVLRRRRRRRRR